MVSFFSSCPVLIFVDNRSNEVCRTVTEDAVHQGNLPSQCQPLRESAPPVLTTKPAPLLMLAVNTHRPMTLP